MLPASLVALIAQAEHIEIIADPHRSPANPCTFRAPRVVGKRRRLQNYTTESRWSSACAKEAPDSMADSPRRKQDRSLVHSFNRWEPSSCPDKLMAPSLTLRKAWSPLSAPKKPVRRGNDTIDSTADLLDEALRITEPCLEELSKGT